MKIIVTGGRGMLGRTLRRTLADHDIVVADLPEWDITDADGFVSRTLEAKPDAVIHCAAINLYKIGMFQMELIFQVCSLM